MELVTTKICMALDLGVHGNLFGGSMMSFLDEAAAAYACQISSIPISDRVKLRYSERFKTYGRGLLHPEELEKEKIARQQK